MRREQGQFPEKGGTPRSADMPEASPFGISVGDGLASGGPSIESAFEEEDVFEAELVHLDGDELGAAADGAVDDAGLGFVEPGDGIEGVLAVEVVVVE